MQILPTDIQLAGNELAFLWNDHTESYIALEAMRRACPCASCRGEPDVLGQVDVPLVVYDPDRAFKLRGYGMVGGYAFQPTWEDGHSSGLYPFSLIRQLGQASAPGEPTA